MALKPAAAPTETEIENEAARLADKGLAALGYQDEELERAARLTWKINRLKKEKKAVIPAHVYQRPEILLGVADFVGDSYKLAKLGAASDAKTIIFCGGASWRKRRRCEPGKEVLLRPRVSARCRNHGRGRARSSTPARRSPSTSTRPPR